MNSANSNPVLRRLPPFMLLTLCCLLAGCIKLGPDFQRPDVKVSADWLEHRRGDLEKGDFREWWKLFNDPSLNRLVNLAYRQNLDLHKAAIRIMEARAQLGIAKGSWFPQKQEFGTDLNYNKLSDNMPNITEHSFSVFQAGFDAAWELDFWGRFQRGIESAGANLDASILDYDDVLVSLTAEVASTYLQIRTFEQRLQLARENADLQQEGLRIADAQFRNGLSTELDMQQAKALLHATRALISSLEIGLRQAKNALCILLAMPPNHLDGMLDEHKGIPEVPVRIAVGIPADVLRRRPDVRREELHAAAQSAMIGVAKADLFPRFSLQGSIGLASSNANGTDVFDIMGFHALAAKFGPTVSWPILQYGRLKNNVRVQDAKYQELLVGYRHAVLRALKEVEDAMVGFLHSREQVGSLVESVQASLRAVDLSLTQYRDGLEDYTRVLNSQQFLVQQQDKLTASRGEVARNAIAMYKALGGGWELRKDQGLLPVETRKVMEERTDWGEMLRDYHKSDLIDN